MKHLTRTGAGIVLFVGALTSVACGGDDGSGSAAASPEAGRSGGSAYSCDDVELATLSEAAGLTLTSVDGRENVDSVECTFSTDNDDAYVSVLVGDDAAMWKTGEPVSGVGAEALSDGESMWARDGDTQVSVRIAAGIAQDPITVTEEQLTETTRILLDQATS